MGIAGIGIQHIMMVQVLWFGEQMAFQTFNRILQIHMMVLIIVAIGMIICFKSIKPPMPIMLAMM